MNRFALMVSVVPVLGFATFGGLQAQTRPCPPQTQAQNYNRGTDPKAGGVDTAQNYNRGTDPKAGGAETAQNYNRGTDPKAGGVDTAQNYNRGTDPKAGGVDTAQNYNRGTDPKAGGMQLASNDQNGSPVNSQTPTGHVESTGSDSARPGVVSSASDVGCR